jgi:hypothetical protein
MLRPTAPFLTRSRVLILAVVLAVQLAPAAGASRPEPLIQTESSYEPLPNFDIRWTREQSRRTGTIAQRRVAEGVTVRWNDQLDLPHSLFSYESALTRGSDDDPEVIAERFVSGNRELFQISPRQIETARVSARATDVSAGFTRLAFEQQVNGVRVFDSEMLFIIDLDGRVLSQSGSFIPEAERRAPARESQLTPEQALQIAAEACGSRLTAPITVARDRLPSRQRVIFSSDEVDDRSEASLAYYPVSREEIRLAYQVLLYGVPSAIDSYLVLVDANNSQVLRRESLTFSADSPRGLVFTKENPTISGNREMVMFTGVEPVSPKGWVSDTRTEGNNTRVFYNPDAQTNGGESIEANADGSFDFPLDLASSPLESFKASATNLFYWVNAAHDRFYALGFNEAFRNFQAENFDKGGRGGDPVRAETLRGARIDPSSTSSLVRNNAYFSGSLDGTPPLLAMLMWVLTVDGRQVERDSSYDAGVIIHEYTHGVTTRMAGTDNSLGLRSNQGGGMGEGWSDFFAASFLDDGTRALDAPRPSGVYLTERPLRGIRAYPYSTNTQLDPLTFGDIQFNPEVHAQGTVWCTILWDLRQALIERYGFNEGRQTAEQLVVNGLKTLPLAPLFTDGRDAILLADRTANGGANQDLIWRVFARRGLGSSASVGATNPLGSTRIVVTEGYDIPPSFTAGSLLINDRPPAPAVISEPLPLVVLDRDLNSAASAGVRATNLRTNESLPVALSRTAAGRFAGTITLLPPEADGGPAPSLRARPGDEIGIKYDNERNQSGTAESLEVRATAGRRIVVYVQDFEQGVNDWSFPANSNGTPNYWHVTGRRAVDSTRSLLFAKEKPSRAFTTLSSRGTAVTTQFDLAGLLQPRLEFDYFFSGYQGDVGLATDLLTATVTNVRATLAEPSLPTYFDARPANDGQFRHAVVNLRFIQGWRGVVSLLFTASSAEVKRKKKFEGFYLDNFRVTGVSTR